MSFLEASSNLRLKCECEDFDQTAWIYKLIRVIMVLYILLCNFGHVLADVWHLSFVRTKLTLVHESCLIHVYSVTFLS